ncbi:hypothetical protein ACKI2N_027585 [Cupriavidus sp. 30B13]|uniref:hypothetical protein n=1 Tax=Cupriavidus sp. 30B13 TaxID=3384241 RepID=UPI003B8F5B58
MCNMCNTADRPRAGRRAPASLASLACSGAAALLALAGCAQLPESTATAGAPAPRAALAGFVIPPDALGARDPQLASVLAKAGTLAARQGQPATVLVTALAQDLPYLNQAIWKGVPAQRAAAVRLENLTAGAGQPYSVTVKTAR